jgi:fatty-acyl-CoA synthase
MTDTIGSLLRARAGDPHPGLLFADDRWTWGEVVDESARRAELALRLRRPGPFHIGVCLENVPEYLFWVGAAALAGAAVVGINTTRPVDEIARDVRLTDCQLIVTNEAGLALIGGADLGMERDRILTIDSDSYASTVAECSTALPDLDVPPETLLLLLFTSGSTGAPKAVCCSTGRLADRGRYAAARYEFTREDVCYNAMPLFHGNAMMGVWAPALRTGSTLALAPKFTASGFLRDVRHYQATFFNYVGRTISYLLATPERPDDRENTLTRGYGTEASWKDIERFQQRFGCVLTGGYGMSEGGGVNIGRTPDTPKGALGRPIVDTIIVVDADTFAECPPARFDADGVMLNANEAIGEIVNTAGLPNFEGYYNNPEATAERSRNGWFWTGDLAYRDERGFFWFAGRSGDRIRVDSENFSSAPIETVLYRFPGVAAAAVYAVPDPEGSDAVMAALELDEGVAFDPEAFAAFLSAQPDLAPKWVPQFVRIVAHLPQTATGKISKHPLRVARWSTAAGDEVWWRRDRRDRDFVRFDADAERALVEYFADRGRSSALI